VQTLREEMDDIKSENDELTLKVDELTSQVTQLQDRNEQLAQENIQLKERLSSLSLPGSPDHSGTSDSPPSPKSPRSPSSIEESSELEPFLDMIVTGSDDMLLDVSVPLTPPMDTLDSGSLLAEEGGYFFSEWLLPNPMTAGLCLLVILFSFGIFVNPIIGFTSQKPDLIPPSAMGTADTFDVRPAIHSTGRHLCQQGDAIIGTNSELGMCARNCVQSKSLSMEDVFRDEQATISSGNCTVQFTSNNNEFHNVGQRKMVDV